LLSFAKDILFYKKRKKGVVDMITTLEQTYDPHLLYHAINITVELEYKVPMQKVYKILALVEESNKNDIHKVQPNEVLELLKLLGDKLEDCALTDSPPNGNNLQAKIKELLRLLGCTLSDAELNKILKGEVSLDQALSKQARRAWITIFDLSKDGRYRPNKEIVENMLICSQALALESIELKIQRAMEDRQLQHKTQQQRLVIAMDKSARVHEKERYDPVELDRKRAKLKLYIAHMQGYDRDRDRDGGRGIDMTTGEVIDFEDIYIADKTHGSIIDDIERDGIDLSDIH
jgi:hypothetical protein